VSWLRSQKEMRTKYHSIELCMRIEVHVHTLLLTCISDAHTHIQRCFVREQQAHMQAPTQLHTQTSLMHAALVHINARNCMHARLCSCAHAHVYLSGCHAANVAAAIDHEQRVVAGQHFVIDDEAVLHLFVGYICIRARASEQLAKAVRSKRVNKFIPTAQYN